MVRIRLDSAEKKRRRRQRYKEKRARPPVTEEERNERRRRKHSRYNEKRPGSQESFAPSSQDSSSQHPATNASISRHQNHQRLIVETVGADESDDEDELPDTNAILQASQQSIHAERMEAVVGGPSERMDIDAAAAASVPIPPPPDAFVGAWNHPLFLGYLRNHPNNPNPGVIPQVQAPPWVAASENRHAQVDCGVARPLPLLQVSRHHHQRRDDQLQIGSRQFQMKKCTPLLFWEEEDDPSYHRMRQKKIFVRAVACHNKEEDAQEKSTYNWKLSHQDKNFHYYSWSLFWLFL